MIKSVVLHRTRAPAASSNAERHDGHRNFLAVRALMAGRSFLALVVLFVASATALRVNLNQVARIGSSWPSAPRFFSPASLDFCPFALSQNFPRKVFGSREQTSPSVTLLLDDLCLGSIGSIGSIGAEVGVTLRYLRLPSTGKVRVLAMGSRTALKLFLKATHRWADDSRITWVKA